LNSRMKRVANLIALAATFFFSAFAAHAERATFRLAHEVHWGSLILQPGDYAINIPLARSWPQEISLTLNGKTLYLLPVTESGGGNLDHSYLLLIAVRNTYFVSQYNSGPTGKQFTFRVPKEAEQQRSIQTEVVAHEAGGPGGN